ncbi:MAG: ABC transporter ATP-binding protein [Gammaproteobacteria bacterium]|nr:ABC transporter ATP-binding protein [Gammaproteobacteria bacterium]
MRGTIIVQRLGKRFAHYHPDRPSKFKHLLGRGRRKVRPVQHFWGLRNINFTAGAGRMVGVIGANGAGKSTLLRLVGGVGRPDEGRIQTYGRIGALLDLGAGSHPDLSGRDNVFVTGVIGGLSRREVARRFDSIVAFAELEDFMDDPLRTYSSGMQLRLAFAVAVHIEPDILLIDEVLSVGDLAFQRKCVERISEFKQSGCTILLISHDIAQVEQLCDEVIWLQHGHLAAHGNPKAVVEQYKSAMAPESQGQSLT